MISWSFELLGTGWLGIRVRRDSEEVDLCASFLTEPLRDILYLGLVMSSCEVAHAAVSISEEPSVVMLSVVRDGPLVEFLVERVADLPDHPGKQVLLSGSCSADDFIRGIVNGVEQLVAHEGVGKYEWMWTRGSFPFEMLHLLARRRDRLAHECDSLA